MLEIWHKEIHDSSSTQQAYNQIYERQGMLQRDSFYLWLISLLKPVPGKTLLDISCGMGRLPILASQKGLKSIGADFAFESLRIGKSAGSDAVWLASDGEQMAFSSQSVDYITHIGSLEHYINPLFGAREIARLLKPEGRACILLPNAFGAWGNIKYVWQHGEIFDDGQPLQRYATRNTWQKLLIDAGLKIDRVIGYGEVNFPRTTRDLAWLSARPQKIIRGFISLFIPVNLSNHFVFICSHG